MSQTIVDPDGSGLDDVKYDYTYDADGIRVSQTVTTDTDHDGSFADETPVTTQYLNDTNNPTGCSQVLEERDITGVTIKTYKIGLTVDTQQSSAIYNGGALFLLKDGHGSTRMLVDATGQVVNSGSLQIFRYDAFGNRLDTATALTTLLYSGEQTDATGLQYLRARYYNPNTGRFNSLDPYHGNISDPLSLHKYLYCHGDGINYTDPTGRFEGLAGMLTSISDAIAIDVLDIGASMVARKFAFAVGTVAANWVTVASAAANILMHPLADGLIVNFNWGQSNAGLGVATTLSLYFSRLKVYVYWSGEFGFAPLSACANPIHSGANWGVNAGFVWNSPSPNCALRAEFGSDNPLCDVEPPFARRPNITILQGTQLTDSDSRKVQYWREHFALFWFCPNYSIAKWTTRIRRIHLFWWQRLCVGRHNKPNKPTTIPRTQSVGTSQLPCEQSAIRSIRCA